MFDRIKVFMLEMKPEKDFTKNCYWFSYIL